MQFESVAVEQIPIERLLPDPDNVRKKLSPEELAELVESIRAHGIRVPLIGYRIQKDVLVCDGNMRLEAAKAAELKTVPVIVLPDKPGPPDMLLTQLVINDLRHELNPIDRFEAYIRLMELKKWSPAELAKGLSVKAAKVSTVLALGKLTTEERELVRQRKIAESSAYALARVPASERSPLVAKAVSGELTRDRLYARVRRQPKPDAARRQRINVHVKGGSLTVRTADGLTLSGLIELLEDLIRNCRKARSDGLDILTAVRVFRDRSRAQSPAEVQP